MEQNWIRDPFYKAVVYVLPPAALVAGVRIIYHPSFIRSLEYWQLPVLRESLLGNALSLFIVIALLYLLGHFILTTSNVLEQVFIRHLIKRIPRQDTPWLGDAPQQRTPPAVNFRRRYEISRKDAVLKARLEDSFEKYIFSRNIAFVFCMLSIGALAAVVIGYTHNRAIVFGAYLIILIISLRVTWIRYDWYDRDIYQFEQIIKNELNESNARNSITK